jgi:PAS domain S-box-containing protein
VLLATIDRRLKALKADEDSYYYEILDRWLSHPEEGRIPSWVWVAGAATVGALLLALVFVLLLRRQVRVATSEVELSRQRYRTVAEYAHGWEFWTDPHGRFVYVSPNTEEVTGYPALEFYEDEGLLDRVIMEEDLPIWHRHLEQIHTSGGEERSSCAFRIITRNGETRWVEHRCARINNDDGAYLGRRGSNIDITDRVLRQQALERSIREKEVMLQEIHHRVKNNLQMVSSLISLQKHSISDAVVLDQLESIANRISTMGTLHSTIYREESFGEVDMREYVESIVSQLRNSSDSSAGIEVHLSVEQVQLELAEALPCGLIINEALTNAYKHAFTDGERGEISVTLESHEGDSRRLCISDNGVGIPGHHTAAATEGGIGFQLILALAEQLRGTARWHSDAGTTVEVIFPRRPKTAQSGAAERVRTEETPPAR